MQGAHCDLKKKGSTLPGPDVEMWILSQQGVRDQSSSTAMFVFSPDVFVGVGDGQWNDLSDNCPLARYQDQMC